MDVIQILVFLGIIGWGLFQARTQKQKKPKRVKTVRQAPPAASFSVEEEVPEEVILKQGRNGDILLPNLPLRKNKH